jgi:hypothetical protein
VAAQPNFPDEEANQIALNPSIPKAIKLLQKCQETCLIDGKKHDQFV